MENTFEYQLYSRYRSSAESVYRMFLKECANAESTIKCADVITLENFLDCTKRQLDIFYMILTSKKLLDSSKITYLNAVKQLIKYRKCKDVVSLLIDQFISEFRPKILETEKKNKLDSKEKDRWITWPIILTIFQELREDIYSRECLYMKWQQYLCLAMYIYHPPLRLDYGNVPVLLDLDGNTEKNYIYFDNEKLKFIFHLGHDKVVSSKGVLEFVLNDEIVRIIIEMEAIFGHRKYLLTDNSDMSLPLDQVRDNNGFKYTDKGNYKYLLSSIPYKGNHSFLCIDTIRSSFYTYFSGFANMSFFDKEYMAIQMRSSFLMMEKSYRKV